MPRPRAGATSTLRLTNPTDLIASIPYLLGFHPHDSLVAVGLNGKEVVFTGRGALATRDHGPGAVATDLLTAFRNSGCTGAILVGFGTADRVTPCVDAARELFTIRSIQVREALRVTDGRYWSYVCDNPRCCPPEGTPFDGATSSVPATLTVAGLVAQPDRSVLAASMAPVEGPPRVAMARATSAVENRLDQRWPHRRRGDVAGETLVGDLARAEPAFTAEGVELVRRVVAEAEKGAEPPGVDVMAELCVALCSVRVRDEAWARVVSHSLEEQLALWLRVMRHAEPSYRAAPGSLAAFTAWRLGRGSLANLALDRVAEVAPEYSMARMLRGLLERGIPPSEWKDLNPDRLPDPGGG
ncbi:DUF4192 domain-containing protein [Spiractinospora alimapuensis]|uniref:DUF4192 domain-containing protein n=1 Tax=Spiractinospora alimapuensis TaxID=2820884 RepID=UPI001F2AE865|nr:DUF4192 domain-containing protein [Spiractinospora alimapuensis]QVQ51903.1 DUF4192 domain-containing protein [Spiractinospora alimapuensis]